MELVATTYGHIVLDSSGTALIAHTGVKVVEMIKSHLAFQWGPEELSHQYPHLSLGQIYSALAYYWDHKDQMDAKLAKRAAMSDAIEAETPVPDFIQQLRRTRSA